MKRIIASVLSVLLLLSFTVITAFASSTDDAAEYYSIETTIVNKCEAFASTDKVRKGSDETVTFTAELGDFMYWEFYGEYEIVEGEVGPDGRSDDNVVVLKPLSDIKAYAEGVLDESREGGIPVEYYRVSVEADPKDSGTVKADPAKVEKYSEDTVTFTAEDTDGYSFVKWEFTGEFDIVSGKFDDNGISTDKVVVVKPRSDVKGIASFEKVKAEEKNDTDKSSADEKGNTSSTSPKTGGSPLAVAVVMLTALCAAAFAIKKIRE